MASTPQKWTHQEAKGEACVGGVAVVATDVVAKEVAAVVAMENLGPRLSPPDGTKVMR
jgi:hypothetical protein